MRPSLLTKFKISENDYTVTSRSRVQSGATTPEADGLPIPQRY
jgi:hypothetical protein